MRVQNANLIIKFYKEALKRHPLGIKSYRWSFKREQEARFKELLKVIKPRARENSVLDVGAGRGDLYKYLTGRGIKVEYTGIDLIPKFVSDAKKNYPKTRFLETDFLKWRPKILYDYVIASGLLNAKIPDNEQYLRNSVKKMLLLARLGVSFNFLTTFRKKKFKRWHYNNPGQILNWCLSLKEVKHLTMNLGYDPSDKFGDATILLFK